MVNGFFSPTTRPPPSQQSNDRAAHLWGPLLHDMGPLPPNTPTHHHPDPTYHHHHELETRRSLIGNSALGGRFLLPTWIPIIHRCVGRGFALPSSLIGFPPGRSQGVVAVFLPLSQMRLHLRTAVVALGDRSAVRAAQILLTNRADRGIPPQLESRRP